MTGSRDEAEHPIFGQTSAHDPDGPDLVREAVDDAPVFEDVSLLMFAPTRILPVALAAVLLAAIGVVGLVTTPYFAHVYGSPISFILPLLSVLVIVFGISYGAVGYHAYATFTEAAITRLMRLQIVGFWGLSTCFLVGGLLGGSWLLTFLGLSYSQSLGILYSNRRDSPGSSFERLIAMMRPLFIGECIFAIVAAPLIALISVHFSLFEDLSDRYISNALIVPAVAIIVLILLLRRRRRE